VRHREKWRLALDMLDEVTGDLGLAPRTVVADAGYGEAIGFRLGLTERGLSYVLAVKSSTSAHPGDAVPERPPHTGQGRPPVSRYCTGHSDLQELVMTAGRSAARQLTWRHGSRKDRRNPAAAMRSRFVVLRVRPANRDILFAQHEEPETGRSRSEVMAAGSRVETEHVHERRSAVLPLSQRTSQAGEASPGEQHLYSSRQWTHGRSGEMTTSSRFLCGSRRGDVPA
jgi:SRSO17 transposase